MKDMKNMKSKNSNKSSKSLGIISTFFALSLFATTFFVSPAMAYVSLTFSSSTIPSTIVPGSSGNLLLTITDVGTDFAGQAVLTLQSSPYVTASVTTFNLGTISAGGSSQITIPITVSSNAPEGTIALPVTVTYNVGTTAGTVTTQNSATIAVTKRTLLQITNVTYDKSEIQRGDTMTMSITLKNVGGGQVKDLTVALRNFSNIPLSPASTDTEIFIGTLNPGQSKTASFNLIVSTSADIIPYSIPVTLSYFDDQGNSQREIKYAGLKIVGIPDFVVSIEKSDNIFAGASGTLSLSIANDGTGSAKYVTASATASDSDVSPNTNYVGNMDPDDTNTVNFDISPLTPGKHEVTLHLTYKDSYNQDFSKDYPLTFTVTSAPIQISSTVQIVIILAVLAIAYWKRSTLMKLLRRKSGAK